MSAPELITTDIEISARDDARMRLDEGGKALLGTALLTGLLAWITHETSGGWVPWSIFVLGALAAVGFAAVCEFVAGLVGLYVVRRDRRTLHELARHTRRTYGGGADE